MTSPCPTCSTWSSCAARSRTPASSRSTRAAPRRLPGVVAVVTGELMAQHNLAWMPTLSGDTQAVLATDKVRFQGQEVAAVVAESAYIARDALELIDVDYEILPAVTSPQQALADGAPVIRDDKEGQTDNHIYDWEAGDKEATDRAFAEADKVVSLDTFYPRCHPAPLECCGCVADVNPATGKATIYMTSQAPHAHRTLFAIVAGLPEHQIRIVSPDIGGGFGNKVPIYPGYVVATAASLLHRPAGEVDRGPLRQPDLDRLRPRLPHARRAGDQGRPHDGPARVAPLRQRRVLRRRPADPLQGRALPHLHGLLRHPGGARQRGRRLHEQGPGRRRLPVLVPGHRGVVPDRAPGADGGVRARRRPGRLPDAELHQAGAVPVHVGDRVRVRLGRLQQGARPGAREARLRGAAQGAGGGARGGPADRDRRRLVHRGRRRRAGQDLRHRRPSDVRLGRASHPPDRQGDPQAGRRSRRARATRRPTARSSPRSSASRPSTSRSRRATPTTTPYGLGTYASRSTPVSGRRHGGDRAQAARQGAHDRRAPARGVRGRPRVGERRAST